jgi:hypothetical protein
MRRLPAAALRVLPRDRGAVPAPPARTLAQRRRAQRDPAVRADHRRHRTGLWRYSASGDVATLATAPVIYSMIVPFLILDAWVSIFHAICFRAWAVQRVPRRDYFVLDRHKLAYLNGLEKANCLFCSYANGVIGYVREVASRTEQYWCPIRHARRIREPHGRYQAFAAYGDPAAYRAGLGPLRDALKR